MQGFPPPPDQRWTTEGWSWAPQNRWAFQHVREIVPTARVARAATNRARCRVAAEPVRARDRARAGRRLDRADQHPARRDLHRRLPRAPRRRDPARDLPRRVCRPTGPTCSSRSASPWSSCVAGVLVERGQLDVDAPLTTYVPEVADAGYAGATVRDILDMRSGIAFNEDYLDPAADVRHLRAGDRLGAATTASRRRRCTTTSPVCAQLASTAAASSTARCETDMLGWVCERASGTRMPTLLSEVLWAPLGTEQDMDATVDRPAPSCTTAASPSRCATSRRFGQLIADDGRVGDTPGRPGCVVRRRSDRRADSRAAFAAMRRGRVDAGRHVPQPVLGAVPRPRRADVPRHPRPDGVRRPGSAASSRSSSPRRRIRLRRGSTSTRSP